MNASPHSRAAWVRYYKLEGFIVGHAVCTTRKCPIEFDALLRPEQDRLAIFCPRCRRRGVRKATMLFWEE